MNKLIYFFAILAICAVSVNAKDLVVQSLKKDEIPKVLKYDGNVKEAVRWNDDNGINIVILSETGDVENTSSGYNYDARLYAYHFVNKNSGWKLLSRTYDFVEDCPVDVYAVFLEDSLSVTDLNANGTAEVSFLYKSACKGDVSPSELKLIMREGKDKYAIRGSTRVQLTETQYVGGEKKIDPAYSKAPKAFLQFSLSRWKKYVNETPSDQD